MVCKHDAVDLKQRPSVIFNEIYSLVYDNADLIEILLGENGDLNFVNRLKQLIREKMPEGLDGGIPLRQCSCL